MKKFNYILFFYFLLLFNLYEADAGSTGSNLNSLAAESVKLSKQGKHFLAINYINRAIKIQPDNLSLYYKRAFIFGRAGFYRHSIKDFNRVVGKKNYPHAVRFRADCYVAINKIGRAVKDYKCFLKNAPKDGKVWLFFAEALYLGGDRKGALKAIKIGIKTKSHWEKRLIQLQKKILFNEFIIPHTPLSN